MLFRYLHLPLVFAPSLRRQAFLSLFRYYGYRLGSAAALRHDDPRVSLMKDQWFRGRRCLDVGCNEGVVTLAVASNFGSASMLGIDIDQALIHRACTNLSKTRSMLTAKLTSKVGSSRPWGRRAAAVQVSDAAAAPAGVGLLNPGASPASLGSVASVDTNITLEVPLPEAEDATRGAVGAINSNSGAGPSSQPPPAGAQRADSSSAAMQGPSLHPASVQLTAAACGQVTGTGLDAAANAGRVDPCPVAAPCLSSSGAPSAREAAASASASQPPAVHTAFSRSTTIQTESQPTRALNTLKSSPESSAAEASDASWSELRGQIKALSRVTFKHGNFLEAHTKRESMDAILCLSVTKWIQLHHGDDGIMRLFHKFYATLSPGK